MNATVIKTHYSNLDPINKLLFQHMADDLTDANWISQIDGEIEVKSKFYIEAAIDYVNFLLADDESEDLLEAKEVVERQLEFLRRVSKPVKSALVIDQVGILASGKSQFTLSMCQMAIWKTLQEIQASIMKYLII